MRDDKFSTKSGINDLDPSVGTHYVMFINQYYFDSYGCPPPLNIANRKIKRIYSDNQIQKNDSYCAAFCSNVLNLTKIMSFKNSVLIFLSGIHEEQKKKINTYSA